jgi:hypothetical protein
MFFASAAAAPASMVIGFPTFTADLIPDFVVHIALTHTLITIGGRRCWSLAF